MPHGQELPPFLRNLIWLYTLSLRSTRIFHSRQDIKTGHSPNMLIPKAHRNQIYSQLFKDGVLVAPKNFEVEHPELEGIANLHVVKAMQSLTSKGFVHTQFSWQWYFYVLTNEGLEYLREYLHLPSEIVPATHKRPQRPARSAPGPREGGAYRAPRGDRPERGGDRDEYRSRRDAGKEGAPGEGFRPRYAAAGVGRGAPQ